MNNIIPKRGEIWLADFDPSVGTEIQKTRPALIISNDIANEKSSKVCVVPFKSNVKKLGMAVIVEPDNINNLQKQSLIRVPEINTFDKRRLKSKIGQVSLEILEQVEEKLKIHLGLY